MRLHSGLAAILTVSGFLAACALPGVKYKTQNLVPVEGVAYLMYSMPRSQLDVEALRTAPVHLVNRRGEVVHEWRPDCPIAIAHVYKNLELGVACVLDTAFREQTPMGVHGSFRLLDRNSKVLWKYENSLIHHEFERTAGDGFIFLQYRELTAAEKKKIGLQTQKRLWVDQIIQVNRKEEITWFWDSLEDLDADRAAFQRWNPSGDLTHGNSVKLYPVSPWNRQVIVAGFRNTSTVKVIDVGSKKVLWRSPSGMTGFQHDASLTPEGKILVFDNQPNQGWCSESRVLEIDTARNSAEEVFRDFWFSVDKMGAVQKIGPQAYLITDSIKGYAFEINGDKAKTFSIWNLESPPVRHYSRWYDIPPIYKIERVNLDEVNPPR